VFVVYEASYKTDDNLRGYNIIFPKKKVYLQPTYVRQNAIYSGMS
jgi:hypothetical protein